MERSLEQILLSEFLMRTPEISMRIHCDNLLISCWR
jgi:hypothetical protein